MQRIERLAFFGTPQFAVPTLRRLVEAGRAPLVVVSQPARPAGRGRALGEPPLAAWAREHGLTVVQPQRVREERFLAEIGGLDLDAAVVVAFGQIFPPALLALPRLGCLNLHASLLPRHRGAAPIQAAIAAGDPETGVTTMQMTAGLDSGPILLQRATAIGGEETAGELGARLAELGAELVVETLRQLAAGTLAPRPQDDGAVTYAPRIEKSAAIVDWSLDAATLARRLRAQTPWPGLEATLHGGQVKLVHARAGTGDDGGAAAGTFLGLREGRLAVACGAASVLEIAELQRAGRRPLAAVDFANGERLRPGERFA